MCFFRKKKKKEEEKSEFAPLLESFGYIQDQKYKNQFIKIVDDKFDITIMPGKSFGFLLEFHKGFKLKAKALDPTKEKAMKLIEESGYDFILADIRENCVLLGFRKVAEFNVDVLNMAEHIMFELKKYIENEMEEGIVF